MFPFPGTASRDDVIRIAFNEIYRSYPLPGTEKNKIYSKNMVSCTFINPLISVVTITRPKVCFINPNGYVCVGVSHTSQIATLYNRDDSVMIHQWI